MGSLISFLPPKAEVQNISEKPKAVIISESPRQSGSEKPSMRIRPLGEIGGSEFPISVK